VSLRPAIPRQVAPQQSPPPLHLFPRRIGRPAWWAFRYVTKTQALTIGPRSQSIISEGGDGRWPNKHGHGIFTHQVKSNEPTEPWVIIAKFIRQQAFDHDIAQLVINYYETGYEQRLMPLFPVARLVVVQRANTG
jgi:hypothetical protein